MIGAFSLLELLVATAVFVGLALDSLVDRGFAFVVLADGDFS